MVFWRKINEDTNNRKAIYITTNLERQKANKTMVYMKQSLSLGSAHGGQAGIWGLEVKEDMKLFTFCQVTHPNNIKRFTRNKLLRRSPKRLDHF